MSEEYGPDFITLTDEEGNEFQLEYLDTLEQACLARLREVGLPLAQASTLEEGQDEDSEEYGLIILRCVPGDEEDTLESVDDETVLNAVYDLFMETLFEEEEDGE